MSNMTTAELQIELEQRVRSAGQGGLTTAEDLRIFLSHLLECFASLNDANTFTQQQRIDDSSGFATTITSQSIVIEQLSDNVELHTNAIAFTNPDASLYASYGLAGITFPDGSSQSTASGGGVDQTYVDNGDQNLQNQIATQTTRIGNTNNAVTTNTSNIGILTNLTTTVKTSLVNAINEVNNNNIYQRGTNGGTVVLKGDGNTASNYKAAVVAGESCTASGGYTVVVGGYLNVAAANDSVIIGGRRNQTYPSNPSTFGTIIGSENCVNRANNCFISNSSGCSIAAGCDYTTLIGCNGLNVTSGTNQTYVNNVLISNAGGHVLISPNGTKYQLKVDNSGVISTTAL